jgi:oligopeptidase A
MARALDVSTERLGRAGGAVSHLNIVADTPELRAAYNAALPRVTEFWTRLGSDERLYAKYKAIDAASLNTEQKQAQKNALRGFVLGGAELQGAAKERYAAIQERLAEITQKFSENTLDATDSFALYVGEEQLKGVPEDVVQATRQAAEKEGKAGCRLTLKMPVYLPVMQFAESSALREQLYKAHVTRASDQSPEDTRHLDNSALIQEILTLHLIKRSRFGTRKSLPLNSQRISIKVLRDSFNNVQEWEKRCIGKTK